MRVKIIHGPRINQVFEVDSSYTVISGKDKDVKLFTHICEILPDITPKDIKPGVRIKLREDLKEGERYDGVLFVNSMEKGSVVKTTNKPLRFTYEDCLSYIFSLDMIERIIQPVESVPTKKVSIYDLKYPCYITDMNAESKNKLMHALDLKWQTNSPIEDVGNDVKILYIHTDKTCEYSLLEKTHMTERDIYSYIELDFTPKVKIRWPRITDRRKIEDQWKIVFPDILLDGKEETIELQSENFYCSEFVRLKTKNIIRILDEIKGDIKQYDTLKIERKIFTQHKVKYSKFVKKSNSQKFTPHKVEYKKLIKGDN